MSKPEDPAKCMTAEAVFAREKGWNVSYHASVASYFVIPPKGHPPLLGTDGKPTPYRGVESAWGVAAFRAGYRPNKAVALHTRPILPLKPRQKGGSRGAKPIPKG